MQGQAVDDRRIRALARTWEKAQIALAGDFGSALAVAEAEAMGIGLVLKVEINAFFLAQAGNEVQVRFAVLHAVFARLVGIAELEGSGIAGEALFLEDLLDDFHH